MLRKNHSGMETEPSLPLQYPQMDSLRKNHSGMETTYWHPLLLNYCPLRKNHSGMETT